MHKQNAKHLMFDLFFEDYFSDLEKIEFWKKLGSAALSSGGFTVMKEHFELFEPHGLSGFWLLSESHLSVHTWPEKKHVFLDFFSCADSTRTDVAAKALLEEFEKMGGNIVRHDDVKRGFVHK